MSDEASGVVAVHSALRSSFVFVYRHGFTLVGLSFAWSIASLPIVTIGPATVGAYAAIRSIREKGWVDVGSVLAVVRRQAIHASFLANVVVIVAVMGVLYGIQFLTTGSTFAAVMAALALYVAAHLGLVMPMALLGLAREIPAPDALKAGYRWTVERPFAAIMMGSATVGLFVVSVLLTVAVVLVFPAVLFSFHVALLDEEVAQSVGVARDGRSARGSGA